MNNILTKDFDYIIKKFKDINSFRTTYILIGDGRRLVG